MKREDHPEKKYLFWIIVAALVFISYMLIKPFLVAILSSFILAYLVKPVQEIVARRVPRKISALICALGSALIIVIPCIVVIAFAAQQGFMLLQKNNLDTIQAGIEAIPFIESLDLDIHALLIQISEVLIPFVKTGLLYLPTLILNILITFVGMYYILINWDYLKNRIAHYLPFEHKEQTIAEIEKATHGIVYGTLLIGMIEFAVAGIGFYILGVKYAVIWAGIIFVSAFIPGIGPAIAWAPLAIYNIIQGNYATAIGVVIIGLGIVGVLIDTFVRGKILEKTAKINAFIMIIGILGGVTLFGVFGFIIGPLILVYTIKILESIFEATD